MKYTSVEILLKKLISEVRQSNETLDKLENLLDKINDNTSP